MRTRIFEYKRKLKLWITGVVTMISWIGFAWWIDSQELIFLEGWVKWIDDIHFLISLAIIMLYFSIIMVIVHFYWKLIELIVRKLVDKFY